MIIFFGEAYGYIGVKDCSQFFLVKRRIPECLLIARDSLLIILFFEVLVALTLELLCFWFVLLNQLLSLWLFRLDLYWLFILLLFLLLNDLLSVYWSYLLTLWLVLFDILAHKYYHYYKILIDSRINMPLLINL